MYGSLLTFYSLDRYYTGREVGCQVKFFRLTGFFNHELARRRTSIGHEKAQKGDKIWYLLFTIDYLLLVLLKGMCWLLEK